MEPAVYMSQGVFVALMYIVMIGLAATVGLLLFILFKEMKNKTLW